MALSASPTLVSKADEALEALLLDGTEVDAALPLFHPISLRSERGWNQDIGSYLASAVDEVLVANTHGKAWQFY